MTAAKAVQTICSSSAYPSVGSGSLAQRCPNRKSPFQKRIRAASRRLKSTARAKRAGSPWAAVSGPKAKRTASAAVVS